MLPQVLSALNPIPLLRTFKALGVEEKLTNLVYGESMVRCRDGLATQPPA